MHKTKDGLNTVFFITYFIFTIRIIRTMTSMKFMTNIIMFPMSLPVFSIIFLKVRAIEHVCIVYYYFFIQFIPHYPNSYTPLVLILNILLRSHLPILPYIHNNENHNNL